MCRHEAQLCNVDAFTNCAVTKHSCVVWSLSQLTCTPRDREVATLEESRNNEGRRQYPAIYFSSKEKGQSNQKEIPETPPYHESCRPSIWENIIPFQLQPIVSNKQSLIDPTSCLIQPYQLLQDPDKYLRYSVFPKKNSRHCAHTKTCLIIIINKLRELNITIGAPTWK